MAGRISGHGRFTLDYRIFLRRTLREDRNDPRDWGIRCISRSIRRVYYYVVRVLRGEIALKAPVTMFHEQKERADALQLELENPIADLAIESPHKPVISEREPNEKSDNVPGIFIIFRDVRVINRGERNWSIECVLKIKLNEIAFLSRKQINNFQETQIVDLGQRLPESLGVRFPDVFNIDARSTIDSYFAFFIGYPILNSTKMAIRVGGYGPEMNLLDIIRKSELILEVVEHIS
jgi:hypothetical protein